MMSDSQIVKHMISFIEDTEKAVLAAKLGANPKSKVVGDILKELEREVKNADKEH